MNSIRQAMEAAGCSQRQIDRFLKRVEVYLGADSAYFPESSISPVESLVHLNDLPTRPELLREAAMIKLNGGLGTSMGLTGPKGLLEVKEGKDFYSILDQQVRWSQSRHGFRPALLFMNSFSTQDETRKRLSELGFKQELPLDFLQSQVPKICPDGSLPKVEQEYAWCPPGHGDIYASLLDSGLNESLLQAGVRYLFVSNIDNLGAVLDSRPLAYMKENGLSFLMEVTRRGESDKKGGHLAYDREGRLLLREVAQCPEQDLKHFQDVGKHRFFNTNNLWIDLESVDESWTELPLIVNKKPVIPHQSSSQIVVQLEQAMGAAIGVVDRTGAVEVGRDRFLPVKTTNDLFLLRSDLYSLGEDGLMQSATDNDPTIDLDPAHYKMIADFERLVPSVPSILELESLTVKGPVRLSRDMRLKGEVTLEA